MNAHQAILTAAHSIECPYCHALPDAVCVTKRGVAFPYTSPHLDRFEQGRRECIAKWHKPNQVEQLQAVRWRAKGGRRKFTRSNGEQRRSNSGPQVRNNPNGERLASMGITLMPSLLAKGKRYAKANGISFSEVVRTALRLLFMDDELAMASEDE